MLEQIKLWETTWSRYVAALQRLDERRATGRRTQMARRAVRMAAARIRQVCGQLAVDVPSCV